MEGLARTVSINTALLWLATAFNWSVIVLAASLTALTVGLLFELPGLAGVGVAAYLLAVAVGGLLTGRAMDRFGRRNGLVLAFLAGAFGALVIYLGISLTDPLPALIGLLLSGLGAGGANLARVAGADMYPPERRAQGISLILFGAAFGAIGAPIVFAPALAGAQGTDPSALAAPWLIAAGLMLAGALTVLAIRVDPREVAERLRLGGAEDDSPPAPARPLAQLVGQPMVPLALLAAVLSQAVMASIMALAGLVLADHGHDLAAVSLVVSVHFLGMFGLVLVVGRVVSALGRLRSVVLGLLVLAAGVLLLLPGPELHNFMPGMFAVGVGWNIAFVASTTILADAALPNERGRLLGAGDFLSVCGAAVLSVLAGVVLGSLGLAALVVGGVLLALVPAALIAVNRERLQGLPAAQP